MAVLFPNEILIRSKRLKGIELPRLKTIHPCTFLGAAHKRMCIVDN